MHTESLLSAAEAGATIVAANARTQRQLHRLYDARQQERHAAWPTPAILWWGAWIEALWKEYVLTASGTPPVRLNALQERVLWEQIVRDSEAGRQLMAVSSPAELACEAWRLLQEYCVEDRSLLKATNDGSVFRDWADEFEDLCGSRRWLERARVPEFLRRAVAERKLLVEGPIILVGFDQFSPQQKRLFAALRDSGCSCEMAAIDDVHSSSDLGVLALNDRAAEIQLAAEWARVRLQQNPAASVGIVVPDLESVRNGLERVFTEILAPESLLGSGGAQRAFELSLGRPLSAYPMIHAALQLLRWVSAPLPIRSAGALIRTPYLGGAQDEAGRRALLDLVLYNECGPEVTVAEVQRLAVGRSYDGTLRPHSCAVLAGILAVLLRSFDASSKAPSAWSKHFASLLKTAGWPGDRTPDSTDHQTRQAWLDLLGGFASLDAAEPVLSAEDAIDRLTQFATQEIFQPENVGAPVQVLGALEASGSRFDHLWVMGLDDESWPARSSANPLLPPIVQKRYSMPHASSADDLQFAQRVTERLCHSAPEVVFSYPRAEGERTLRPSPLLAGLPRRDLKDVLPLSPATWIGNIQAAAVLQFAEEESHVNVAEHDVRGGTRVFQLQAACPFRAFAELRLGAKAVEDPVPGLSPIERGQLVHLVLQVVWQKLDSSSDLLALTAAGQRELVGACVDEALRGMRNHASGAWFTRFTQLERDRLIGLVSAWLDYEKTRAPFKVIEREEKKDLEIGGVRVSVRVDRVDELTMGGKVIIDYKTGAPKKLEDAWDGNRPDEPQLPLYAVANGDGLAALAFAHVRPGENRFRGEADALGVLPGVKPLVDQTLRDRIEQWRGVLVSLGEQFLAGQVDVDPKNAQACRRCFLGSFCRRYEVAACELAEEDDAG